LHYELLPLMNINFIESNPIPVKAALHMMGLIENEVRLPLVTLSQPNQKALVRVLNEVHLLRK
jgi:4-hydroxy-tetrahydrodipicolinate synthase